MRAHALGRSCQVRSGVRTGAGRANPCEVWFVPYLRLAKLLAVMLYASGTIGAALPLGLRERRWFAYRLAGPGFGLTWFLGLVWATVVEVSLVSRFILGAMVCSFVSLQAVLYLAGAEGRGGVKSRTLAIVPLVLCFVFMVLRP